MQAIHVTNSQLKSRGALGTARPTLCLLILFMLTASLGAQTVTLTVTVTGARNTNGTLGVALFKDAQGFPEDPSRMVQPQAVPIDAKTLSARVVFTNIPPGGCAISARHDENANGKLDKNFVGMPKEGYAISNNPKPKMRPPTFDEAKFSVKPPTQHLEIKLLYR